MSAEGDGFRIRNKPWIRCLQMRNERALYRSGRPFLQSWNLPRRMYKKAPQIKPGQDFGSSDLV